MRAAGASAVATSSAVFPVYPMVLVRRGGLKDYGQMDSAMPVVGFVAFPPPTTQTVTTQTVPAAELGSER